MRTVAWGAAIVVNEEGAGVRLRSAPDPAGDATVLIHVEARVRDTSTGSGWRIADPRTRLGGVGVRRRGTTVHNWRQHLTVSRH